MPITFNWPTHTSEVYSVDCTSGGALIIHGSEEDHYAICKRVGGVNTYPPFIPRPSE
ncbi:hypothetical protein BD770DRAFT_448691 [Pilaira anomala]|nr:hypothetical protein BD770DRAFT_448691 [Pilaira anomala]